MSYVCSESFKILSLKSKDKIEQVGRCRAQRLYENEFRVAASFREVKSNQMFEYQMLGTIQDTEPVLNFEKLTYKKASFMGNDFGFVFFPFEFLKPFKWFYQKEYLIISNIPDANKG